MTSGRVRRGKRPQAGFGEIAASVLSKGSFRNLRILVPSRSGLTYQLESRPDFNTDWSDVGAAQPGTGADLTLTHSDHQRDGHEILPHPRAVIPAPFAWPAQIHRTDSSVSLLVLLLLPPLISFSLSK